MRLAVLLWLVFAQTLLAAEPAKPWQRLDGCKLIPNRWNDGDSFHVQAGGEAYLFRLYFVDTPEAETEYAERTKEQADYFGVTPAEAVKLGEQAAGFSKSTLAGGFTIYTRWNKALGRSQEQRYYALIYLGKTDYAELLVSKGLARIYGSRTPLPDGRDSRAYLAHLATVEAGAKAARLGGWKRGQSAAGPSMSPSTARSTASPTGTDFDRMFKKPR